MISSYRGSTPTTLKNIGKEIRPENGKICISYDQMSCDGSEMMETCRVKEIIRHYQLTIMELKNDILKKEIETKAHKKQSQERKKQLERVQREKMMLQKFKKKFEYQRKEATRRIQELQDKLRGIRQTQNVLRSPPRDRYDTCIRQLDMLRTSLDDQETKIKKQRDFYKDIFEEVKSLSTSDQLTAQELKQNLCVLFKELSLQENDVATSKKYKSRRGQQKQNEE